MMKLVRSAALFLLLLSISVSEGAAQATQAAVSPGAGTPPVFENPALARKYQSTITPEELASHLYIFASDYFEGRETATRGQKLAALYLATQYRKLGLAPKGTVETSDPFAPEAYFQPFNVYARRLRETELAVIAGGKTVAVSRSGPDGRDGRTSYYLGTIPDVTGEAVFVGYGIADSTVGYDDFAALAAKGIDPSGKWVVILGNEPLADSTRSLLKTKDGKPSQRWTMGSGKLEAVRTHQPLGILVVSDAGPQVPESWLEQARAVEARVRSLGRLSMRDEGLTPPVLAPIYLVTSDLANQILSGTGRDVASVKAEIDRTLKPVVFDLPDVQIHSRIDYPTEKLQTENVLAFIEGSDPVLKDEVVVLSAHYDHIGLEPGNPNDTVNNGADDDGSGTVALLEIADAFMQAKRDGFGPRRSILFLTVTGEEKGLLGSAYYSDVQPVIPIEKIVTDLNIDMIGRFDPTHPKKSENYVYIIGSKLISQELHDINARVNDITGTRVELDERFNSKDDPNRFYMRSDHWNFGKYGVPFIFFFTGTHEDYHMPGDEPQKIAYDRMARITRLIFGTAWQVANQDTRPAVSGKGFNE